MVGLRSELMKACSGNALVNSVFHSYAPHKGRIGQSRKGVLVSSAEGMATEFSLANLEPRGILFVSPGDKVYSGMIIGEHSRDNDLDVNPTKEKKLTNVRAAGKDER